MNINQKIGQLFIIGFPGKKITKELKRLIHEYYVGGIVLFRENIENYDELTKLTQQLQKEAKLAGYEYPLFISIDEENGTVKRLGDSRDGYPGAMSLSATNNSNYAYDIGNATGKDLKKLGINWNYAPVLDINNNSNNPVIGVRSFGETAEAVSEFGIKFMKGLQDAGVAGSLKHFPGHGDTNVDSHHDLPIIEHDLDHLEQIELKPFKNAINEGADSVMIGHILFPALEPDKNKPATLSKNIITGLLRNKLNFKGVIITDALEMKAISETVGIDHAAVQSLKAGADSLLIGHEPNEQIKALKMVRAAVNSGEITEERVDQSLRRIKRLKKKYTQWEDVEIKEKKDRFNRELDINFIKKIYGESVTIVKQGESISPDSSVLVLETVDQMKTIAEDRDAQDHLLLNIVKEYIPNVDYEVVSNHINGKIKEKVLEKVKKADHIIVGITTANKNDSIFNFINELTKANDVNIISMKDPYIGKYFKNINYWINTYEPNQLPIEIAIRTLIDDIKPTGISPVKIK